jgi:hypothetical protein
MVLRKAYDTVNKVGRTWMNLNQGNYNNPAQEGAGELAEARALLARVVADWPQGTPETPALIAARDFLRREGR